MRQFFRNEKGNILVFSVASLVTLLLFASMAIDVGCILTARNQLQCAVDASALAGATGLVSSRDVARAHAVAVGSKNTYVEQPVQILSDEVSFPAANQVSVQITRPVPLFFLPVIGVQSVDISAIAVAELSTIVSTKHLRPWGLPDMGWPTGAPVVIKSGSLGAPSTEPSFFYPVDYPPLNRGNPETGGDVYRENIIYGCDGFVSIGDIIQVEPGNMIGPTKQGLQDLIAMDPYAYWDGDHVANSQYPGASSPRIVKIPLYDPNLPPDSGRNTIEVIGLASFFVVGLQGNDVIGIYMEKVTDGRFGSGYSFLMGTRLIQ